MKFTRILFALILCTSSVFSAPKSRTELAAENIAAMPSGVVGVVTAQKIRDALQAVIDNAPNWKSDLVFNVKAYGAKGDGTTNDTAALAACFAAAPEGATIYFPGGTYLTTTYLTIGANHQTIIGYGAKIISNATGQDRKFLVSGRTGIKFIGLRIDGGNYTVLTPATAFDTYKPSTHPGTIHFVDSTDCEVQSCEINNVNWPITLLGACDNIAVRSCDFASYMSAIYGYFSGSGAIHSPAPKRIAVESCRFYAGLIPPITPSPEGSARVYPANPVHCTGAIKFRLAHDLDWYYPAGFTISNNRITAAGMMGIEIQAGANDSTITGNSIADVDNGISLSHIQRATVTGNTIRNVNYCGIELDGRTDGLTAEPSNEVIALTGNVVDCRDEYGRPFNFHNNVGIVLSNISRRVNISGGVLAYCKTGVVVQGASGNILLSGVQIITNGVTGDAGLDTGSQAILIYQNTGQVDINGCYLAPSGTERQRMVYINTSSNVRISGGSITSNLACVYLYDSSDVTIDGVELRAGSSVGGVINGFAVVESYAADCLRFKLRNCTLKGTFTEGVYLYASGSGKTISDVTIENNNTEQAAVTGFKMLLPNPSVGTIGRVVAHGNSGPGNISEQNNLSLGAITITGTFSDSPTWEVINCEWETTLNLQTAVNNAGKRKRITLTTDSGFVAITPTGSQTINGATGSYTLRGQWSSVELISDGTNWKAVSDPASTGLKVIGSASFSIDFGSVNSGDEATVQVSVPCAGTTGTPSVALGWSAALPSGLVIKQARVTALNQVSITARNVSGSTIGAATVTGRATVFEY